jgi:hypothetical protein
MPSAERGNIISTPHPFPSHGMPGAPNMTASFPTFNIRVNDTAGLLAGTNLLLFNVVVSKKPRMTFIEKIWNRLCLNNTMELIDYRVDHEACTTQAPSHSSICWNGGKCA